MVVIRMTVEHFGMERNTIQGICGIYRGNNICWGLGD